MSKHVPSLHIFDIPQIEELHFGAVVIGIFVNLHQFEP